MEGFKNNILRFLWVVMAFVIPYLILTLYLHYFIGYQGFPDIKLPIKNIRYVLEVDSIRNSYIVAFLIAGISALLNPYRKILNTYGDAHWATKKEIKKMGLKAGNGLIFGKYKGMYIGTDEPISVLIYAPKEVGKTAAIVIPSLLISNNSAIVFDVKGELLKLTAPFRSQYSKIIQFAPGEKVSARWNPLSKGELPESWAKIQVHLDRVANSIIPTENTRWAPTARSIFMFWGLLLIHNNGETSLPEILERAFKESDQQKDIREAMAPEELPKRIMIEGNSLASKDEKEFSGVLSTFKTKMSVFLDETVANNLRGSDFSLMDLKLKRTTVYLNVRNSDMRRLETLLGLFCELAAISYINEEPKDDDKSITFFFDEFVRIGKMKEILSLPAINRSYRVNAIFVCKSFKQLVDRYGAPGAKELINTCAYHIFFTQKERTIAENLSKKIGKTTRYKRIYNRSHESVPLISPQDILSLKFGRVLICKKSHFNTPIDCKAIYWFNDKEIKKRVNTKKDKPFIDIPKNGQVIENKELEEYEYKGADNGIEVNQIKPEKVEKVKKPFKNVVPEKPTLNNDIVGICDVCGLEIEFSSQIGKECTEFTDEGLCAGTIRAV